MIVLVGPSPTDPVVTAVQQELERHSHPVRVLAGPPFDVFGAAFDARAEVIVHIEPLPELGAPPPPLDDTWSASLSGTRAPGVRKLVWVTSRDASEPAVARVKSDGVNYVVLRAGALAHVETGVSLRGRRVLVRSDRPHPRHAACTTRQIAEEVRAAIESPERAGCVLDLALSDLDLEVRLVRDAGGEPTVQAGWRATALQWIGTPLAIATDRGATIMRAFRRPTLAPST